MLFRSPDSTFYSKTISGFMNSETELNAAGYSAPICTSSYTTSSPAGPLTISCSGGSATNYNFDTSATATLTISNKTAQTITFNSPGTQTYKTNFSVSATTTASGLSVTITTSGDCTGSGTGTVTITPTLAGSSNCTLTASQAGDADRKSTRLNSSHMSESRMPSSA